MNPPKFIVGSAATRDIRVVERLDARQRRERRPESHAVFDRGLGPPANSGGCVRRRCGRWRLRRRLRSSRSGADKDEQRSADAEPGRRHVVPRFYIA